MSPSRRFLLAYLLWVGGLFLLLYLDTNPISRWVNEVQRTLLLDQLRFFLGAERIEGIDILAHPQFRIFITQACNGLIPFYLYLAAILAFPASWKRRVLWGILGYLVISAVNLLRLLFVTAMVARSPDNFPWAHDLLGNLMLMAVGLGLFLGFIRQGNSRKKR